MSMIDLVKANQIAQSLALKSGSIIKKNFQLGIAREWKSDYTPVTKVDKEVNSLVIQTINKHYPDHKILGEEESDLDHDSDYVWVCDPIDGTFPFMHGIPTSTFVLALVKDGSPILGVIYDPFMKRMFSATQGYGAFLNNDPIHTKASDSILDESIGVVHWKGNMHIFTPLLPKLIDYRAKLFDLVSIAYMDTMVACGEFAATIFPGESPHDSAAAKIIIEEAGGIFTPLTADSDRYEQKVHGHLACANQAVYDQIKALLLE